MRHRAIAAAQHNVGPTDHLLTVERAQGHRMIWQYGSAIKATPHQVRLASRGAVAARLHTLPVRVNAIAGVHHTRTSSCAH